MPNRSNALSKARPLTDPSHPPHQSLFESDRSREARRIIAKLQSAGFVAYLAGGCVRDALLGKPPKDFDVATDATPTAVRELFGKRRTLAFGAAFGVIGVLPELGRRQTPDITAASEPTEVATFRSDGDYSDGRRPDSVHYGNAEQDALRRDFTINGMFYDPSVHRVIDYVGGCDDLDRGLLRTIGDAEQRFDEDKLRMLRAVRFATTLKFRIDPPTLDAIRLHADSIAVVSEERIGAELRRVLTADDPVPGIGRLVDTTLSEFVWPGLTSIDFDKAAAIVGALPEKHFPVVLSCLLMLAPNSEAMLKELAVRWRLSNEEVRIISSSLRHWATIAAAKKLRWSELQPILTDRDAGAIIDVAEAFVRSAVEADEDINLDSITRARIAYDLPKQQLDPAPLLTGNDLQQLGFKPGPQYRQVLQQIRDAQLDGRIATKQEAIDLATATWSEVN